MNSDPGGVIAFPRNTPAYIVAVPQSALEQRVLAGLALYLERVLRCPPIVVNHIETVPADAPAIVLVNAVLKAPVSLEVPNGADEAFALRSDHVEGHPLVIAQGHTDRGLKRAVQRLIFASRQEPDALIVPALDERQQPWIPRREWTACPWTPNAVRGVFYNPYADSRLDIFRYDDARLAAYVEMLDWLGYSGCQLMETCYTYSVFGSVEAAQEWQTKVARALRDNGQEASLWVWAAQFTGFGWRDPDVVYQPQSGLSAFDDPAVRRGFEKYYDHYARLAPYLDRMIGHFFDPGELRDRADVFRYMRLLEQKAKAANPRIQMGIDCWAADPNYLLELAENGFGDYLLLPVALPELYKPGDRERLHARAAELKLRLGIWGWYTTEYETDQLASMYVNAHLLKDFYGQLRQRALARHPVEYWSEMEAHHLNNIYTMYAAAQLLWNPERDPDAILAEITDAIWGPRNGREVLAALQLIQDVRTGPTWETYWWTRPTHRVGTGDPEEDRRRATASLEALSSMVPDATYVPKLPLPYPPEVLVDLMIPHLRQIQLYSEFRLNAAKFRQAAAEGATKDVLQRLLDETWQPIPQYDTWIGVFDTKEVREQKRVVSELAETFGLEIHDPPWLRQLELDRVLQGLRTRQRATRDPYRFTAQTATAEYFWPEAFCRARFQQLVQEGLITAVDENLYQLSDWAQWAAR